MTSPRLRGLRSRLPDVGYRSAAVVARVLPAAVARPLARAGARVRMTLNEEARSMTARHMRRALGPEASDAEVRRAVRQVFDSYSRYWFEAFRMPIETPESLDARMTAEGMEHLEEAFAAGRGIVVALPHLGGWDFGGAWLAQRGFRPVAVAERLEPPELFDWFVEWRRRLGLDIIPADGDAGTAVLRALQEGRTVGLVADRDILGSGVDVEFFGERTTLPAGPAVLALRTGAPLVPGAIYFTGRDGHHAIIRPPLPTERQARFRDDVARITRALAAELEDLIRVAPQQWHLMQPNWPSDPGYGSARRGGPS